MRHLALVADDYDIAGLERNGKVSTSVWAGRSGAGRLPGGPKMD